MFRVVGLPALGILSVGMYLIWSSRVYRVGFPLDDAWIHQTYARNFASSGQWSYIPGKPSGGSTGPLWGGLLSLMHWLKFSPCTAAYFWGYLSLLAVVGSAIMFVEQQYGEVRGWSTLIGAALLFEWHLAWSAVSGMETLLFSFLVLFSLTMAADGKKSLIATGALVGISTWVRPGGVTLLIPITLLICLREPIGKRTLAGIGRLLGGFLGLFLPYLLFNSAVSGAIWPTTFYAKQTEYAVLREASLLSRVWRVGRQTVVGWGSLVIPGFIHAVIRGVQEKRWGILAAAAWGIGYIGLYAWRLPVTYQHGRYIFPALAVILCVGLAETARWISRIPGSTRKWVISRAFAGCMVGVGTAFWLLGARAYARDVAVIESEMVATARWIADHTEPDSLIAAHDIGAVGYFSRRNLLDLAGLISPEVIPIMRDEAALEKYLDQKGADYLVAFPGWYPELTRDADPVYQTAGAFAPFFGAENMAVYRWKAKK